MSKTQDTKVGHALARVIENFRANFSLGDVHTDLKDLKEKLDKDESYLDGSGVTASVISDQCTEFLRFARSADNKNDLSHYLSTVDAIVHLLRRRESQIIIRDKLFGKSSEQLSRAAEDALLLLMASPETRTKALKILDVL